MVRVPSLPLVLLLWALFVGIAARGQAAENFTITPDVVYGHKAGMALTFDVVRPAKPNGAAVLFMVSGAWHSIWAPPELLMGPAPPFGLSYFRELVDKGYTLFIVRHGSAPQFKVPEAVADVRRAVRYIRTNAEKLGIDAERIGVCGASAGGHLSLMLGTASDEGKQDSRDAVERASNRVSVVVAYFPPTDLRDILHMKNRFPALDFDQDLAESVSPLLFVTSDDAPTLLVHGDQDDLVKLSHSERIASAFDKEKVPHELVVIEGAGHGFAGAHGERAARKLVEWFDKYLTEEPKSASKE